VYQGYEIVFLSDWETLTAPANEDMMRSVYFPHKEVTLTFIIGDTATAYKSRSILLGYRQRCEVVASAGVVRVSIIAISTFVFTGVVGTVCYTRREGRHLSMCMACQARLMCDTRAIAPTSSAPELELTGENTGVQSVMYNDRLLTTPFH
jgi:hypothetical protein